MYVLTRIFPESPVKKYFNGMKFVFADWGSYSEFTERFKTRKAANDMRKILKGKRYKLIKIERIE